MNTLSRTARLISAFAAVTITLTLLHTVFAIAEPQRSVLIAKMERADHLAATHRRHGDGGDRRREDHEVMPDLSSTSGRRLQRMHLAMPMPSPTGALPCRRPFGIELRHQVGHRGLGPAASHGAGLDRSLAGGAGRAAGEQLALPVAQVLALQVRATPVPSFARLKPT